MDPYQTLGVSKSASQEEIKNAYRALAKKFHPDLNPGNKEAERKFKAISDAYEAIGTPESRAKFDREGEPFYYETQRPGRGHEQGGRYTYSFGGESFDEDLFSTLFGGLGGQGRARAAPMRTPGEDHVYLLEIDLKDSVLGAVRELTLPTGKKLSVRIPAGVSTGNRLRFAGQGGPSGEGGPPGDAYVELRVRPDRRFVRQGNDLITELPVTVATAVLGGEVRVPTIDGTVLLKIPPRSNSGTRFKLGGKGVRDRTGKPNGDEIVVLKIMLPREIDAELEDALRKWAQRHGGEHAA